MTPYGRIKIPEEHPTPTLNAKHPKARNKLKTKALRPLAELLLQSQVQQPRDVSRVGFAD